MTSLDVKAPEVDRTLTTRPILGVAGALLVAMIATCTGRPVSGGLADIRAALHLGVDEASLMNTSFNASMMLIRAFSAYLGGSLGPRWVLLACARIFVAVSSLIPFCHSLCAVIALPILAGHRLFGFGHVFAAHSTGPIAVGRVAEALELQVRQRAFTLAICTSVLLMAACCVACLVTVALMSTVPTQYRQVVAFRVEAR